MHKHELLLVLDLHQGYLLYINRTRQHSRLIPGGTHSSPQERQSYSCLWTHTEIFQLNSLKTSKITKIYTMQAPQEAIMIYKVKS